MSWEYLPYTVCYEIFRYLNYEDLISASNVCSFWFMVSRDDRLWKKLFFQKYPVDNTINNRGLTWYEEFRRLHYNIPTVQTQVIQQHFDQVLHVAFSHNGKYFVTASRDCLVMIWSSSHPVKMKDSLNMTVFNWRCAHYSEFNVSDTLLLVSGIIMGPETSTSGEIVVFSVEDFLSSDSGVLKLKCRIDNTPYSLFGAWYNNSLLLSGNRFWLGGFVTAALIYINKASQETSSEHIPITQGLFKFYNTNRSSITSLLVARCLWCDEDSEMLEEENITKPIKRTSFSIYGENDMKANKILPPQSIIYNSNYREYENNVLFTETNDADSSTDSSSSENYSETEDKLLIFVTGSNTFIPHEIGIKKIKPFEFPERIDPGPSLKERQMLLDERKRLMEIAIDDVDPNDLRAQAFAEKFDTADHLIDLHGHILGMSLSPDERFLYVTTRQWPERENYDFFDVVDPLPAVQTSISLHVIDLVTLEIVGVTKKGPEETFSTDVDFYFVYMDVTNDIVVSTGEGCCLHLWDRHYGVPLAMLKHKDIVNGAAFNPKDSEMMVSVSDDSIIKIWRSPAKVKEMQICEKNCEEDTDDSWSDSEDSSTSYS